ncbi:DMT family transporter [Alicyclobacillus sp.]|uniref:EamA family transporter n=1 Tax=Alicyclobacillus sp. TaxID=61169 RepID=UPI0025C29933|nr:DMT family transporter [Alicyclobacillus sp.]
MHKARNHGSGCISIPSATNAVKNAVKVSSSENPSSTFGFAGFLLKVASESGVTFFSTLTAMFGGGLGFVTATTCRELVHTRSNKRMELSIGAVSGFIMAISYSCYLYSLTTGPASIVFPIISLNALVVVIAGVIVFGERLKSIQVLGIFLAFTGVILTRV